MSRSRLLPALALVAGALTLGGCVGGNLADLAGSLGGGACGLLILIADVWAIVKIADSTASTGSKLLWAALVFFFPLGGLVLWYLFGPKG